MVSKILDTFITGMSSERKTEKLGKCSHEGTFKNALKKYGWDSVTANWEMNPLPYIADGEECSDNSLLLLLLLLLYSETADPSVVKITHIVDGKIS